MFGVLLAIEITPQLVAGVAVAIISVAVVIHLFSSSSSSSSSSSGSRSLPKKNGFLDRQQHSVPLIKIIELSHDTQLFRFGLPTEDTVLGLPIGKHIKIFAPNAEGVKKGEWNGRPDPEDGKDEISRTYTPTSSDDDLGHFDLVIKIYKRGVVDRFPDGGKMSQYLHSLKVSDSVKVSGPFGLNEYLGKGVFSVSRKPRPAKKHIGMIAGGTGITPMLQVISAILKNPDDKTKISLLFANQSEDDILVRDMIEGLGEKHPDQFSYWYTVDRATPDWKYSTGFVSEEMIRERLPPSSGESCVVLCGPPPMIKFACLPNLEKIGFEKNDIIVM